MMMSRSSFVLLAVLASCLLAAAATAGSGRVFVEHQEPLRLPEGWIKGERLAAEETVELLIAVRLTNTDELEAKFWAVSEPTSLSYGRFLTPAQVAALVAPSPASQQTILQWLEAHGVVDYEWNSSRDFLRVRTTAAKAEELLGGIEFHHFTHDSASTRLFRSLQPYTVPQKVAAHIDFIGGINHFPRVQRFARRSLEARGSGTVDPNVIKRVFNISAAAGKSASNSQSVAQFLEQYYTPSDLTLFQQTYNLPVQAPVKVVGHNDASNPGVEAELDIEYIMGVATNVPTWFVYTAGRHESQEPFLEWIQFINDLNSPAPLVNSVSYGDVESSITLAYVQRVDLEFQKVGLTGKSILFASGDDGVGCNTLGSRFEPNWPATSAYVTAVGGTILSSESPLLIQSDSISSGGFSNYFGQAKYQKAAVAGYLAQGNLPAASYYNISGRAFPDVSAFSEGVQIIYQGSQQFVGGTSCAAPVFSAVIALINDERLQQGRPPLGFLNSQLYTIAQRFPGALLDITSGSDNGNGFMCSPGFKPAKGWDPVTGLGVPNYPALSKAFASLSAESELRLAVN